MEVKIKNQNELIDATIEMVDGVMVVSPKEVKFEPKDGDVIVSGGDTRFVAIFNKMRLDYSFLYYALLVLKGDKNPQINGWASFLNVRPATEEEKKLLFDKLAENGFEWDAEKKQLVKLKWKPKRYEYYYAPFCNGVIFEPCEYQSVDIVFDNLRYDKSWVFKTIQECQEFCARLNKAIENIKP